MKKILFFLLVINLVSCGSTNNKNSSKPLYEVLTQQNDGGASIRFYEILTESQEIKMLQNDDNLKRKIKPNDITTSNFVILNMGEKNSGGYSIKIDAIEETADKIIITTKDNEPNKNDISTTQISYPYTVVKINSKKEIVVK